jgi:hypothetical protein
MRSIEKLLTSSASVFLLVAPVQSADLNFDPIPVSVSQVYKEINGVFVTCDAKDAAGNWITGITYVNVANSPNPPIGNLNATTRSFSGNLQTGLNFNSPADLANAKTYRCVLRFNCVGQCSAGYAGVAKNAEVGDGSQWWHVKSGTVQVEGPIP